MILLIAAIITGFALLAAVVRKCARQFVASKRPPENGAWIEDLATDRYRPMLRLLDEGDFEFLRAQPGFTSKMESRLRSQRCRIFREYLRNMDADFGRISMALKGILLHSNADRPDLASALVHHQTIFAYRKTVLQFQVVLFRYGLGTVDVSELVKIFDGMRMELAALVPAEMPAGA